MSGIVIRTEHLSKHYRLGQIGGASFRDEVSRQIARLMGKPDPTLGVGLEDHDNREGKTIWALRDVNLDVNEGEVLGIIGRNGAGKSTLLKILSRITAPTQGSAKLKGRVGSLLEVGTGFHPELTGRENIFLNGTILGMRRSEVCARVDEIVDFSGVEAFIDTPVKRYSSGMVVRLAFAVAAHLDPEILIVDEVLAVGDMAFKEKCLGKLGSVAEGGRTVLFVSHDLGAIRSLCTQAVLMERGAVSFAGDVSPAIDQYMRQVSPESTEQVSESGFSGSLKAQVRIDTISIHQDGKPVAMIDPMLPFEVHVDGEVTRDSHPIAIVLGISHEGSVLFANHDLEKKANIPMGKFKSVFVYPDHTLKPGVFDIGVGAADILGGWSWNGQARRTEVMEHWDDIIRKNEDGFVIIRCESRRSTAN
jgi:lipopolysaccharide transport system ATP-binding protein